MSSELATSYAALILADDNVEITVKYRSSIHRTPRIPRDTTAIAIAIAILIDGWLPELA